MKEIAGLRGWVLLIVGFGAFWLYSGSERKAEAREIALHAYEVPEGRAEELARVLSGAMPREGDHAIARVTASPDGRVLVAGSKAMQRGVQEVLADIAKRPAPPAPPSIEMTYWVVTGKRAEKPGDGGVDLKEVATALETITKTDGPMTFELLEKMRLSSMSDEHGFGRGAKIEKFEQRASMTGDKKIIADLTIDPDGSPEIRTRVQLTPEQFLVLGESADPKTPGARLYYIVRPSVRG